jgi:hypothetical protein
MKINRLLEPRALQDSRDKPGETFLENEKPPTIA